MRASSEEVLDLYRRFATHLTTGIGLPRTLESQNHTLIPTLGKALFAGAAKTAAALAKRELVRVLRHVLTRPTKELKRQVTAWFVVEKLVTNLAAEAVKSLPSPAQSLARRRLRARNAWGAVSALGAWQLRDCATVHGSPQDMPAMPNPAPRELAKKRSRVTRERVLELADRYEAFRVPPSASFAEHPNNDPWMRFYREVCGVIATKRPGATARTFPGAVREQLEAGKWPHHSAFFLGIPFEPKLGLALSMLLRLRSDHVVWTHRLDVTIDPMLRLSVREARRQGLARRFSEMGDTELADVTNAVRDGCIYGTAMEVDGPLTMGTPSFQPPKEIMDRVKEAAEKHVLLGPHELRTLMNITEPAAFEAAAHSLSTGWIAAIARELGAQPDPPERLNIVEEVARDPPNSVSGDKLLNSVFASLPPAVEASVVAAGNDFLSLGTVCEAEIAKDFGSPPSWTVALPITDWTVATALGASANPSSVLMTIGEIEDRWKPERELAPATPPPGRSRPGSGLTKATLCLVAHGLHAPDEQLAVREGQSRLDAILCGVWFLDARRYRAELATEAFVRHAESGMVTRVQIAPTDLWLRRTVQPSEVIGLTNVASTLARRWSEPRQRDMWRRVSEGMGFLRSASSATLYYERYLFLWMALEALLNNLGPDEEEKYTSAVSIGTRVGYRAALLLVPEPSMAGQTYRSARWTTTLELDALYYLRNKAVHEGRRNPPIDQILLQRFQDKVISVFETVARNGFSYGMRRIEELLAWCEHAYPETNTVPSR